MMDDITEAFSWTRLNKVMRTDKANVLTSRNCPPTALDYAIPTN